MKLLYLFVYKIQACQEPTCKILIIEDEPEGIYEDLISFVFLHHLMSCMECNQGNKTTKNVCHNFYYKYFPSMIFSRKTTFNFSQSNAFIDIGWLKDAKDEYITVRSHRVIDMGSI